MEEVSIHAFVVTYHEMGIELLEIVHDVCNGKMTKAEVYGFSDIAVDHVCRFV